MGMPSSALSGCVVCLLVLLSPLSAGSVLHLAPGHPAAKVRAARQPQVPLLPSGRGRHAAAVGVQECGWSSLWWLRDTDDRGRRHLGLCRVQCAPCRSTSELNLKLPAPAHSTRGWVSPHQQPPLDLLPLARAGAHAQRGAAVHACLSARAGDRGVQTPPTAGTRTPIFLHPAPGRVSGLHGAGG